MALPVPIQTAIQFVESTNHYRMHGPIDAAQTIAAKVALVAIRDYFSQLAEAVQRGKFDPSRELPAWLTDGEETEQTTERGN